MALSARGAEGIRRRGTEQPLATIYDPAREWGIVGDSVARERARPCGHTASGVFPSIDADPRQHDSERKMLGPVELTPLPAFSQIDGMKRTLPAAATTELARPAVGLRGHPQTPARCEGLTDYLRPGKPSAAVPVGLALPPP